MTEKNVSYIDRNLTIRRIIWCIIVCCAVNNHGQRGESYSLNSERNLKNRRFTFLSETITGVGLAKLSAKRFHLQVVNSSLLMCDSIALLFEPELLFLHVRTLLERKTFEELFETKLGFLLFISQVYMLQTSIIHRQKLRKKMRQMV